MRINRHSHFQVSPWSNTDTKQALKGSVSSDKVFFLFITQEANQSSLMSLEMEDYQKSLEALQIKLAEKEKALQDSQEEVSRVDKRAEDFKTQIGKYGETDRA